MPRSGAASLPGLGRCLRHASGACAPPGAWAGEEARRLPLQVSWRCGANGASRVQCQVVSSRLWLAHPGPAEGRGGFPPPSCSRLPEPHGLGAPLLDGQADVAWRRGLQRGLGNRAWDPFGALLASWLERIRLPTIERLHPAALQAPRTGPKRESVEQVPSRGSQAQRAGAIGWPPCRLAVLALLLGALLPLRADGA